MPRNALGTNHSFVDSFFAGSSFLLYDPHCVFCIPSPQKSYFRRVGLAVVSWLSIMKAFVIMDVIFERVEFRLKISALTNFRVQRFNECQEPLCITDLVFYISYNSPLFLTNMDLNKIMLHSKCWRAFPHGSEQCTVLEHSWSNWQGIMFSIGGDGNIQ
ncbi:hypothetical protein O6H91_Y099200 [Diphasiastrum complanatum]|nr:hypothetical protein O6H91_Y099200 [Diphasiastrum complanatum]